MSLDNCAIFYMQLQLQQQLFWVFVIDVRLLKQFL